MIWYLTGAGAWIVGAVAFWKWVLYPIAVAQVTEGSPSFTAFGIFWTTCTILFAVYIMIMREIAANQGHR